MVVSFVEYNSNLSIGEKTRKSFQFPRILTQDSYFENFLNGQSPYDMMCHHSFLIATYFSVNPIEKCCQLFLLLEKKTGLCFSTESVKLTPKISHFIGTGTWTNL